MKFKLVIVAGEGLRNEVELSTPAVIGRSRQADVTIGHPLVSRRHCEITEGEDNLLVVEDLGSLNGTFVGDVRIEEPVYLEPGDYLTVGSITFQALYGDYLEPDFPDENGQATEEMPDFATPAVGAAALGAAAIGEVMFEEASDDASSPDAVDFFNAADAEEDEEEASEFEEVEEVDELEEVEEVEELEEIEEVEEEEEFEEVADEAEEEVEEEFEAVEEDESAEEEEGFAHLEAASPSGESGSGFGWMNAIEGEGSSKSSGGEEGLEDFFKSF